MPRTKKNTTVTDDVTTTPIEEKKTTRRGRPPKKAVDPVANEEVKTETEVAKEVKTEAAEPEKTVKKRATRKTTASKTSETAPKRGRKKKEESASTVEVKTIIQFRGEEAEQKDMLAKIEADWKEKGNKGTIENITMYVKPEDRKIYYLVNGLAGSVDLF